MPSSRRMALAAALISTVLSPLELLAILLVPIWRIVVKGNKS
jgi:hypothetical protein